MQGEFRLILPPGDDWLAAGMDLGVVGRLRACLVAARWRSGAVG